LAEVESTLGTYSISSTSYYKNKYKHVQVNANFLENNTITLPCYNDVPVADICLLIKNYNV